MEILSLRPNSVVAVNSSDSVVKFYKQKIQWEQEASNLTFLAGARKQGFYIAYNL